MISQFPNIFWKLILVSGIFLMTACDQEEYVKDRCESQTSTNIIYHDYDNDGDLDITSIALYHIKVFENDGLGNFTLSCVFQVDEDWDSYYTIDSRLLVTTALDNDNIHNDIIGLDEFIYDIPNGTNQRSISLTTYTDLGLANANFHTDLLWDVSWPENNWDVFENPKIADVNKDGLNDLIYGSTENSTTLDLVWHQNLGNGRFDPNSNPFPYYEGDHHIINIFFEDLNNDNKDELLLFDNYNRIGKWYDFSGTGELLSEMDLGERRCRTAVFDDMNGDGLKDVIMLMEDYGIHVLYRDSNNINRFIYSEDGYIPMNNPIRFYIADIDGDSRKDILIHYYSNTDWRWIRNELGTPDWEWKDNNQIDISILDTNEFERIRFEDIDADGDTDFFVLYEEFEICVFKNNNGTFTKTVLN